jgi:ATP-dependent helicase/DNAse subunit B
MKGRVPMKKKMNLKIIRTVKYPFYQAALDVVEEEFLDNEYKIVWDEADAIGISVSAEERVEIFQMMNCIIHLHQDGVDYFYCRDLDEYWEDLSSILDKKG